MELFENRRYPYVFAIVCDNPSKCVLNTVIKATTHQGISRQDSSLISQVMSNLPEITHLNEACLTNITDMISKGEISIKQDTKVLYATAGCMKLPNILTWR